MHPKWVVLALVVGAAVAPLSHAHEPAGTPDFTCQTPDEWEVHDYAAAHGWSVAGVSDNNLEECGTTYGVFVAGTPECRELETRFDAQDPSSPVHALWLLLCQTDRPADYDGDMEFAIGGAVVAVDGGDGATYGSLACLGTPAHHGNVVSVKDEVFTDVAFTVSADASLVPPLPGEPDCGDGVHQPCTSSAAATGLAVDAIPDLLGAGTCNPNDRRILCLNVCTVPFGPGADGMYLVHVHPTVAAGPDGTPTGASHGHITATGTGGGASPGIGGPSLTLGSGGTMWFDGSGGEPGVSEAPGWACDGPFAVGGEWEIRCSPIGPLTEGAVNRVACTSPYAVAGGTAVSFGTAGVKAFCSHGLQTSCSTSWLVAGACVAPPLLLVDSFPLHCRAQVTGSTIGGTLFASCGNLL